MGRNADEITIKTLVTGANFAILELADLFGPKGTAFRILMEALERGLGGLWIGGHASMPLSLFLLGLLPAVLQD
jgi:hypothetical protein